MHKDHNWQNKTSNLPKYRVYLPQASADIKPCWSTAVICTLPTGKCSSLPPPQFAKLCKLGFWWGRGLGEGRGSTSPSLGRVPPFKQHYALCRHTWLLKKLGHDNDGLIHVTTKIHTWIIKALNTNSLLISPYFSRRKCLAQLNF